MRYLPAAPKEMILSGGIRDETAPRFMRLGIILLALAAGFILLGVAVWPRLPQ